MRDEEDTLVGFKGTPWHSHAKLMLMLNETDHLELDEFEIISGIMNGDIVVIERYTDSKLTDRWLGHVKEKIDIKYIETDEEIRIRRIA